MEGKCLEALGMIQKIFPNLLKEFPKIEFFLNVQHFIELVKQKNYVEAITFAKGCLSFNESGEFLSVRNNKIEGISLDVNNLINLFD